MFSKYIRIFYLGVDQCGLLNTLFVRMPFGLILGVAPKPRQDPYNDWSILADEQQESINPASVYTCTAGTRWLYNALEDKQTYASIGFDHQTHRWHITSHSSEYIKTPRTPTPL